MFFLQSTSIAREKQVTETNERTDEAQLLCYKKQEAPNLQKKSGKHSKNSSVIVRVRKLAGLCRRVSEIYSYYC